MSPFSTLPAPRCCLLSSLGPTGDVTWVTTSLVTCGILSKMGWEMESVAKMRYVRLFPMDGAKRIPNAVVVETAVHHSLTMGLGLSVVLRYRSSAALHRLCFDLQFAGAAGGILAEYSRMLNIFRPGGEYLLVGAQCLDEVLALDTPQRSNDDNLVPRRGLCIPCSGSSDNSRFLRIQLVSVRDHILQTFYQAPPCQRLKSASKCHQ